MLYKTAALDESMRSVKLQRESDLQNTKNLKKQFRPQNVTFLKK